MQKKLTVKPAVSEVYLPTPVQTEQCITSICINVLAIYDNILEQFFICNSFFFFQFSSILDIQMFHSTTNIVS